MLARDENENDTFEYEKCYEYQKNKNIAQKEKLFIIIHIVGEVSLSKFVLLFLCLFSIFLGVFQLPLLQQSVVDVVVEDVEDAEDVEDVEMPLTLVAVTTWGQAVVELRGASTDVDVDVEDVEHAAQTTGVLPAPCVLIAREDLVPQLLAQDATLAAALVSLSLVHLAPL